MLDSRAALEAIGLLPDTEIDIAEAALQLARIDASDADWRAARKHLSEIARRVVELAPGKDDVPSRVIALSRLLSRDYGYAGDAKNYEDPANANLIRVIERRRGLPVALGIIWLHAARAAGWPAHGVDFPAHFLVALTSRSVQAVLDVFRGGMALGADELHQLLKYIEGDNAELRPGLLRPMNTRRVLLRLQNNIASRRVQAGDLLGALVCIEDMLRFAPEEGELWRQAAIMNQRLDRMAAALRCFEQCLALTPKAGEAARIRSEVDQLRGRLN